jgi:hypothetical protein
MSTRVFKTYIEWERASTFEEIETWFCLPMQEYLKMFDEQFVESETAQGGLSGLSWAFLFGAG